MVLGMPIINPHLVTKDYLLKWIYELHVRFGMYKQGLRISEIKEKREPGFEAFEKRVLSADTSYTQSMLNGQVGKGARKGDG